ncbi:MAG: flavodoxin-dependent (E)-4-hydroxy-3-methylbut-2-enyl-diphosphate synthase, partial [Clostridia bacterium]|nr:flavodoxin-dependent (E)-4-hydroxy-3-methylbut-2-enyl-diphosphate synthase [Clostridia bacterium]
MTHLPRRATRPVRAGRVTIGGDAPVSIQSMTNADPHDREAVLRQVRALTAAGCEIVRLAVPDPEAADVFSYLKENDVGVPLVADIHFDYRLALRAVSAGADKIRINPGNIGSADHVREVVRACRSAGVPIRVGVNSGSLERDLLAKHGAPTPAALAESAMRHVALLERFDFDDIVLSVKSSSVPTMIETNRLLSRQTDHPLHLGVTEAGAAFAGVVKGAVGIGALLSEGIGDTIRVSLTGDPVEEVRAARAILSALSLGAPGMDIVACPTCGRTRIDLPALVREFERRAAEEGLTHLPLKVALMGCAVNGPGEAREADIGIAGGVDEALLF